MNDYVRERGVMKGVYLNCWRILTCNLVRDDEITVSPLHSFSFSSHQRVPIIVSYRLLRNRFTSVNPRVLHQNWRDKGPHDVHLERPVLNRVLKETVVRVPGGRLLLFSREAKGLTTRPSVNVVTCRIIVKDHLTDLRRGHSEPNTSVKLIDRDRVLLLHRLTLLLREAVTSILDLRWHDRRVSRDEDCYGGTDIERYRGTEEVVSLCYEERVIVVGSFFYIINKVLQLQGLIKVLIITEGKTNNQILVDSSID